MATLVYAPQIKVIIETTTSGQIDVSEDLVNWQLNLRENAPHTFTFQLQNAQRKYDGRLLPMDKISIKLKRLNWLQSFTGYLNNGPVFQAWPGTLNITATCTLKIPQFWYWDPTTSDAQAMLLKALNGATVANTDTSTTTKKQTAKSDLGDNGLSGLIVTSMTQVLNWDKTRIHIGQIPNDWFKWAGEVSKLIGADEALYKAIGASYTAAGDSGVNVLANLPPGSYGGMTIDKTQAKNASIIATVAQSMKVSQDVLIMSLMCGLDESSLRALANHNVPGSAELPHEGFGADHGSVGVFQQQPSQGWGTVAQCQATDTAARTFIKKLNPIVGHNRSLTPAMYGTFIQKVQVSAGDGSNYQQFLRPATAMATKLTSLGAATSKGAGSPTVNQGSTSGNGTSVANPRQGFKASGSQVAAKGLQLIAAHKPPAGQYIHYSLGGDDPADTDIGSVTKLDCSSLVDWCYYQATGLWLSGAKHQRSNVASIASVCKAKGAQVDLKAAYSIQGAVFTKGANEHTALSVGDGATCVAAKTDEAPLKNQVVKGDPIGGNGFDRAWLMPGVDYSQSATTNTALKALQKAGVDATKLGAQLGDGGDGATGASDTATDPFLTLLNNLVLNPVSQQALGQTLGGPVALINDEPFLPWLQSLVNGTMRSFCSAPNGDFIAWFPDYFGIWGSAGKLIVEPIELQDFTVDWSDQQIVTHQFVLGNPGIGVFDQASASIGFGDVATDLLSLAMGTAGIATFDYPEIFKVIYGKTAPAGYIQNFLARFGARPDVQQMPFISKGTAEFFMALYLFVQRWAAQFTANVPMTFMPEAFPGMLLQIPHFGFQAYVQGVTHSGSYGDGGAFQTSVDICAPSNLGSSSRDDLLSLLPLGSNVKDTSKKAKNS